MQSLLGSIFLTILNLLWPGAALIWRRQLPQCIGYAVSFGILSGFRHDIGIMWALYVWLLAQLHFQMVRNPVNARPLSKTLQSIIWITDIIAVVLYYVMYGPHWTHNGAIKEPTWLFVAVIGALVLPSVIVTRWLAPQQDSTQ